MNQTEPVYDDPCALSETGRLRKEVFVTYNSMRQGSLVFKDFVQGDHFMAIQTYEANKIR